MASSKYLGETVQLLQTYSGRDKVIRTVSYLSLLLSGLSKSNANSKKLLTISLQLSLARTILRLFDDLPMLAYTLSYGWGRREHSSLMQLLGVLKNAVDQMFFPCEHIAWAADNKLIDVPSGRWWILSISAWLTSLSLGVIKQTGSLLDLQAQRKSAFKQLKSLQDGNIERVRELSQQQIMTALAILADACDMCNAIHWMPAGFLWGGKLPDRWVGFFGTISSLIKLGLFVQSRR